LGESAGRDPEVTPSASPPAKNPSSSGTTDQRGGSKTNVGAIAGGVVGGAAALLVTTTLLFFICRKRRKTESAHIVDLDSVAETQWETTGVQNSQKLYDPSDPSTFPPPASVGGGSYDASQVYAGAAHLGKYPGSAEI